MKKYKVAMMSVALLLNSSIIMAAAITDNYAKGDVLSASTLDNIKTAVNDNNNASRFYGDGSAGPLTISADTDWSVTLPAGDNLNFTDVVVDAGVTLTVPAGTIIRCSGTFTNNGMIFVSDVDNRARFSLGIGKGDARRPSGEGQSASTLGVFLAGGAGGKGIPRTVAAASFNRFIVGGGAGAGETVISGNSSGGGLIKVYCQGAINNNNAITADGRPGQNSSGGATSGGGGGGIIILASSTSITNTASINAKGGKGSSASSNGAGASGGGGGGIVALVAPVINTSTSTLFVNGGNAGSSAIIITNAFHSAGAGGGASGGDGGKGGNITSGDFTSSASNGQDGYILQIHANPARMMQ